MSTYTGDKIYDAVAMSDEGDAITIAKAVDRDNAEYFAQNYSERFGVIVYVFKYDREKHTRYVVKSFFKGNKERR